MEQSQNIELLLSRISYDSDEKAFKQLFDLFSGRLFSFANSFLKNKSLAEEVVSDVFLKLWLIRFDLVNKSNIKAYLFKATYNTVLNYLKEIQRKQAVSFDDIEVDFGVDHICPETNLINKELKIMIEQAVESLPPRCKLIYKMAKMEGLKYKEISDLLDISVKTIDHQLTIATKKMAEVILSYLKENDTGQNYLILMGLFTIEK